LVEQAWETNGNIVRRFRRVEKEELAEKPHPDT